MPGRGRTRVQSSPTSPSSNCSSSSRSSQFWHHCFFRHSGKRRRRHWLPTAFPISNNGALSGCSSRTIRTDRSAKARRWIGREVNGSWHCKHITSASQTSFFVRTPGRAGVRGRGNPWCPPTVPTPLSTAVHCYDFPLPDATRGRGKFLLSNYGINNWVYNPPPTVTEIQGSIDETKPANIQCSEPDRNPAICRLHVAGGGLDYMQRPPRFNG